MSKAKRTQITWVKSRIIKEFTSGLVQYHPGDVVLVAHIKENNDSGNEVYIVLDPCGVYHFILSDLGSYSLSIVNKLLALSTKCNLVPVGGIDVVQDFEECYIQTDINSDETMWTRVKVGDYILFDPKVSTCTTGFTPGKMYPVLGISYQSCQSDTNYMIEVGDDDCHVKCFSLNKGHGLPYIVDLFENPYDPRYNIPLKDAVLYFMTEFGYRTSASEMRKHLPRTGSNVHFAEDLIFRIACLYGNDECIEWLIQNCKCYISDYVDSERCDGDIYELLEKMTEDEKNRITSSHTMSMLCRGGTGRRALLLSSEETLLMSVDPISISKYITRISRDNLNDYRARGIVNHVIRRCISKPFRNEGSREPKVKTLKLLHVSLSEVVDIAKGMGPSSADKITLRMFAKSFVVNGNYVPVIDELMKSVVFEKSVPKPTTKKRSKYHDDDGYDDFDE